MRRRKSPGGKNMRQGNPNGKHEERNSALWGTGSRGGDHRAAKPMRRFAVVAAALAAIVAFPATAVAKNLSAFVPKELMTHAQASPTGTFNVIVQGRPGQNSASVAKDFGDAAGKMKRAFYSINGVAGSLTGAQLVKLSQNNHVLAITPDVRLKSSDYQSQEVWRDTTGVSSLWGTPNPLGLLVAPQAPAIAIVDSGIDSSKLPDFGARVVAHVDFCSLCPAGSSGDLEGHGTMVAGLAAGAGSLYPGVAKNANLVDLRTTGADGASRTSDVLAATDWILQNKAQYGIKVANYSMRSANPSSFRFDPLDAAVESLWFNGVVVVAAAGNFGVENTPQAMRYAPGNDPFVITVGATGTQSTTTPADDTLAPWSAYGHTLDGFSKPEISAPGRMMISTVPMNSTLATTVPERVVAPGYMWMSGTSLAAPIVSGAAAQVLARHPDWTPDQVKGALMKSASALPAVSNNAGGVGEVNAAAAAALHSAPNPQKNLDKFIAPDANGQLHFNGDAWMATVASQPNWSETDWSETDWSETDWSETDWSETDWSETDWSETDWSETDWSETDWSETDWSETDWSESTLSP
jgi:serine protease AprX